MADAIVSNQISIIDLSDLPRLSVYLENNQPTTVTYDPSSDVYTPNWSTNSLVLTPYVTADATEMSLTDHSLSIVWFHKYDSQDSEVISTSVDEQIIDGKLIISKNVLSVYQTVTYICKVTYTSDNGGQADGQANITFTLNKNGESVASCSIAGSNFFLYDADKNIKAGSSDRIILTANVKNTTVSTWQFMDSNGVWTDYNKANSTASYKENVLTVTPTDKSFFNDRARIRVTTSLADVFDEMTIVKIYDGTKGNSLTLSLSNDSCLVPLSENGSAIITDALTIVSLFVDGEDVVSSATLSGSTWKCTHTNSSGVKKVWQIVASPSQNVTGTAKLTGDRHLSYQIKTITETSGYVDFVCTSDKGDSITKRFSLSTVKSGDDAVFYILEPSAQIIRRDKNGVYSPTYITFNAYSKTGSSEQTPVNVKYRMYWSTDGENFSNSFTPNVPSSGTSNYTLESNTSNGWFGTASQNKYLALKCEIYDPKNSSKILDSEIINLVIDGDDGEGGFTVILGNEFEGIPCTDDGKVRSNYNITIPFSAFLGSTPVACTCTPNLTSDDFYIRSKTDSSVQSNGTSKDGQVIIGVVANAELGNQDKGQIELTFEAKNEVNSTATCIFSWVKNKEAFNAINFEIMALEGQSMFKNGVGEVKLQAILLDGASDVTNSNSYSWSVFKSGTWVSLTGSSPLYTVTPDDVVDIACFRCSVFYKQKTYTAYFNVIDSTDPYSCVINSTLGNQVINNHGIGAVYCNLYKGSEEVDSLVTDNFVTTLPYSAPDGTSYYYIANNSVTLKTYSNGSWFDDNTRDKYRFTYNWFFRDKDGNVIEGLKKTGKVIFLDADSIEEKLTYVVEVEDT